MNKDTCVHYNGMFQNEFCKRGVSYRVNFDSSRPGMFLRAPCVQAWVDRDGKRVPTDRRGETMHACPLREEPTDEDVKKSDREFTRLIASTKVALSVAAKWREVPKPAKDRETTVDCPVCKTGKLRMTQSAYNGHVHGACSTEGCVRWVE